MQEDYVIDEVPEHMKYIHNLPIMLKQLPNVPCLTRMPTPKKVDLALDRAGDIALKSLDDLRDRN